MLSSPPKALLKLREALQEQRYSPTVVRNYCLYAGQFLSWLQAKETALCDVTPDLVAHYLDHAVRQFEKDRGRPPASRWSSIPRSSIHALMRSALAEWPPNPPAASAAERHSRAVCAAYKLWLSQERGLAEPSIKALMWEAHYFCKWLLEQTGKADFADLSVRDIDAYMDNRAPGLTRKSLKDVAERLRGFLRHLHRSKLHADDLSGHVIAPLLYAYEGIPSILTAEQIAAVLELAGQDSSPLGLRDHAILQLFASYGFRSGEVGSLQIEDINWRADTIRVQRSKTNATAVLPLMEPVGEAILLYLREGRPQAHSRTVFLRSRAPYQAMKSGGLYCVVKRRLENAGIEPIGKRGPHIFRHARAVSMLRAATPRKVIGDVLGHRSPESTAPYLKLATEDLRAIAIDLPGWEVRQ
ncbi:site-specific integrase (plasmid) [Tritonibacter scottomollicae]|uniref:Site-specific integrase n=2 Tax=Tritonibacter scottomollicae TaxID=483013 RepID=A0A2T1AAJ6_TRISK|nr:site-specific integrase [Tritonibacter scottomollicae]PRZ45621.1 site-specific recombinase XerD [Tritonibacter scottomollicae]WOI35419.1 site-specific integrase [Tritonibacter scottomollicae]